MAWELPFLGTPNPRPWDRPPDPRSLEGDPGVLLRLSMHARAGLSSILILVELAPAGAVGRRAPTNHPEGVGGVGPPDKPNPVRASSKWQNGHRFHWAGPGANETSRSPENEHVLNSWFFVCLFGRISMLSIMHLRKAVAFEP